MLLKIAYYRRKDWNRFLKMIDDKESMHKNWNDWNSAYAKTKKDLIEKGFKVVDIVVDLNELESYCKLHGIKNDGKARSQFVQEK